MTVPPVSVVVPTLNEEHYLPSLLRSLCGQRDVRLEVVVVDGRSDDRTREVARKVADANTNDAVSFRLHTVDVRNVSYQRNHGVARSTSPLLLFLDADVVLPHQRWVRMTVDRFGRTGARIVTCRFKLIERSPTAELAYGFLYLFQQVMRYITPYAMGAMLLTTRSAYDRVGGFDERLTLNEDANFVKRVARHGPFRIMGQHCLVSARRFIDDGYLRTTLLYARIFINRTLHGENTGDLGYWDRKCHQKKH